DVKPSLPCSPSSAAVADRLPRPRPHIPALVCRHHRPAPPSPTSHPRPARRLPPKNPVAVSTLCLPDHLFRFCEGEVALPGEKAEEGDADDAATSLREAKEEIGLDPASVTVVSSLEHFLPKVLETRSWCPQAQHSPWCDLLPELPGLGHVAW
uniref:Nudix hydrolase domain-containing protein n=1 Tax=Triticum urartu TaxID=4572 RepID=A0A8R7UD86_TRIUA